MDHLWFPNNLCNQTLRIILGPSYILVKIRIEKKERNWSSLASYAWENILLTISLMLRRLHNCWKIVSFPINNLQFLSKVPFLNNLRLMKWLSRCNLQSTPLFPWRIIWILPMFYLLVQILLDKGVFHSLQLYPLQALRSFPLIVIV